MILIKNITAAPDSPTSVTEYTGDKAELIAGGVASESMFPVGKMRVCRSVYKGTTDALRRHWKTRQIKGGKFVVTVWRMKDESRCAPETWVSDAELRQHATTYTKAILSPLMSRISGETEKRGSGTISYRYSDDCLRRFGALLQEMSALLQNGAIEQVTTRKKVVCLPVKA